MVNRKEMHQIIKKFIATEWIVPEDMREDLSYIILHIVDELWAYKLEHNEVCEQLDILREGCIRGLYSYVFHKNGYELVKHRISAETLYPLDIQMIAYPDWLTLFFRSVGRIEDEIEYIEAMLKSGIWEYHKIAKKVMPISDIALYEARKEGDVLINEKVNAWLIEEWGLPEEWQAPVLSVLYQTLELIAEEGQYISPTNGMIPCDGQNMPRIIGECTMRILYRMIVKEAGYKCVGGKRYIRANIPLGYERWSGMTWYDEFIHAAGRVDVYIQYIRDLIKEGILQRYGEIRAGGGAEQREYSISDTIISEDERDYIDIWIKQQNYAIYTIGEFIGEGPQEEHTVYFNKVFYTMILAVSKKRQLPKTHFRVLGEALGLTILQSFINFTQTNITLKDLFQYANEQQGYSFDGYDFYLLTNSRYYFTAREFENFVKNGGLDTDECDDYWYVDEIGSLSSEEALYYIYSFIDFCAIKYKKVDSSLDDSSKFYFAGDNTLDTYKKEKFEFKTETYRKWESDNWEFNTGGSMLNTLKKAVRNRELAATIDLRLQNESLLSPYNQKQIRQWLVKEWGLPADIESEFFKVFNYLVDEYKPIEEADEERICEDICKVACIGELTMHALYYIIFKKNGLLLVQKEATWVDEFCLSYKNVEALIRHIDLLAKWQVWQYEYKGIKKVIISDDDPLEGKRMLVSHIDMNTLLNPDELSSLFGNAQSNSKSSSLHMAIHNVDVINSFRVEELMSEEPVKSVSALNLEEKENLLYYLQICWGLSDEYMEPIGDIFFETLLEEEQKQGLDYTYLVVLGVAAIKALYRMIFKKRGFIMTGMNDWKTGDWLFQYLRACPEAYKKIEQVNTLLNWGIYQGAQLVAQSRYTDILK